MPRNTTVIALAWAASMLLSQPARADGPFQATGFKVGEVSDTTAIVWTRLTLRRKRNPIDGPAVSVEYVKSGDEAKPRGWTAKAIIFEQGVTVRDVREAVPGTDGDVRVLYRPAKSDADWQEVDGLRDFTRQFTLSELQPGTRYEVKVESRSIEGESEESALGGFRTAPPARDAARVVFTVSTGQRHGDRDRPDGFKIYPEMLKLDPNFFIHTGDAVYYDHLAKTVDLARYHWQRTYSWPTNVEFHNRVSSYFFKDDHDTWKNNCWPTMQSPAMHDGPGKTIWGEAQKNWFKQTFQESDATFRILVSPTPIIGPDRFITQPLCTESA